MILPYLFFLALAATCVHSSPQVYNSNLDERKYSYLCLENNQDLCLGISPGESDPTYDPAAPFLLQIKNRVNNELSGMDYKKTRWDVLLKEKIIHLSRFPELCITDENAYDKNTIKQLALTPCDMAKNKTRSGMWNTKLTNQNNINQATELIQNGTGGLCATIMQCKINRDGFCDPNRNVVATTGFDSGSYVKTMPCWNTSLGNVAWRPAQTFRQLLDCAVGCPPYLQLNNVCDMACANGACNLDNGKCISGAPTPPTVGPSESPTVAPTLTPTTLSPSSSPTTKAPTSAPSSSPTLRPTSKMPTLQPTTKTPTLMPSTGPSTSPTHAPTRQPTYEPTVSPSKTPTKVPSNKPSSSPSLKPSSFPTTSPTLTPSRSPVAALREAPLAAATVDLVLIIAITIPLLLLLLLCMVCMLVARDRRKRDAKRQSNWSSPIEVNRAAFIDHHSRKQPSVCTKIGLFCGLFGRKRHSFRKGNDMDAPNPLETGSISLIKSQNAANSKLPEPKMFANNNTPSVKRRAADFEQPPVKRAQEFAHPSHLHSGNNSQYESPQRQGPRSVQYM